MVICKGICARLSMVVCVNVFVKGGGWLSVMPDEHMFSITVYACAWGLCVCVCVCGVSYRLRSIFLCFCFWVGVWVCVGVVWGGGGWCGGGGGGGAAG